MRNSGNYIYMIMLTRSSKRFFLIQCATLVLFLRVSEANGVPISSHISRLDDIQTALIPLKKSDKIEINFHDHFRTR